MPGIALDGNDPVKNTLAAFATEFRIDSGEREARIVFKDSRDNSAAEVTISMPWQLTKMLVITLAIQTARHETSHGNIPIPEGWQAALREGEATTMSITQLLQLLIQRAQATLNLLAVAPVPERLQ